MEAAEGAPELDDYDDYQPRRGYYEREARHQGLVIGVLWTLAICAILVGGAVAYGILTRHIR